MSASTRYCGTDVIFSFEIQRQTRSFFCLCYGVLQIFSQIFSSFENLKDYRRCLHPNLLGAGYGREINSCLSGWQASILSCGRNYFSMVLILLLVMGLSVNLLLVMVLILLPNLLEKPAYQLYQIIVFADKSMILFLQMWGNPCCLVTISYGPLEIWSCSDLIFHPMIFTIASLDQSIAPISFGNPISMTPARIE